MERNGGRRACELGRGRDTCRSLPASSRRGRTSRLADGELGFSERMRRRSDLRESWGECDRPRCFPIYGQGSSPNAFVGTVKTVSAKKRREMECNLRAVSVIPWGVKEAARSPFPRTELTASSFGFTQLRRKRLVLPSHLLELSKQTGLT